MRQRTWDAADRRAFTEQRLRAQTVPVRRPDGPEAGEWDDWRHDDDPDPSGES